MGRSDVPKPRVFVTGGGRGIGRAIALRFAREGAQVAVAARTSDQIDSVVEEIDAAGGQGHAAQMNLRDHGSIEAAVYRATDFFEGPIDVLVNNAGIFELHSMQEMDLGTWERFLEVNLTGPFLVTLESLPALKESDHAHIFNVSSIAGKQGFPGNVAYCATKYGLRGFSDSLREDLRSADIRVTTVYPGPTNTTMLEGVMSVDKDSLSQPEDVAEVIWEAWCAAEPVDDVDVVKVS